LKNEGRQRQINDSSLNLILKFGNLFAIKHVRFSRCFSFAMSVIVAVRRAMRNGTAFHWVA